MDQNFSNKLLQIRHEHASYFSAKQKVYDFADNLLDILFPHFSQTRYTDAEEVQGKLKLLELDLKNILHPQNINLDKPTDAITQCFFEKLPAIYDRLWLDAEAIYKGDPAADCVDEVISAYPGFFAIYIYRIAHEFHALDLPIFPRILTEYAHLKTGIDIHPAAQIGDSFFIDHGTGIVVGETTKIGNNVKIYQGVSLGALSVSKEMKQKQRHPTIEDNVIIYSNATILGGNTVIGRDSVIGGNVWLTESVPPYSIVYHQSEIKVRTQRNGESVIDFVI